MLRWLVGGAILGPVLLLSLGFFISNPSALWWVAALVAVIVTVIVVAGVSMAVADRREWTRADAAALAREFDEAEAMRANLPQEAAEKPTLPDHLWITPGNRAEHERLRQDYRGWRFRSPGGQNDKGG